MISLKANKTDIPTNVSSLTNDSGYLTEIPSEYVTDTELESKGYLTSIPNEYVTENELNSKGYLTEHQSLDNYYDKSEVDSKIASSGSFDSTLYYTKTDTNTLLNTKANKTDIPSVPTNISSFNNDSGYITSVPDEYVTESELEEKGYLTSHQDLSNYYTKTDTDTLLNEKANTSDIPTMPTKTSELENDSNFITLSDVPYANRDLTRQTETPGLIRSSTGLSGYYMQDGYIRPKTYTYNSYEDQNDILLISKGTLNNVLTEKDYATKSYVDEVLGNIDGGSY